MPVQQPVEFQLIADDNATIVFRRLNQQIVRLQRNFTRLGGVGTTGRNRGFGGGQDRQLSAIVREEKRHTQQFTRIISGLQDVRNAVLVTAQQNRISVPRPSGIAAGSRTGVPSTFFSGGIGIPTAGRAGLPLAASVGGGAFGAKTRGGSFGRFTPERASVLSASYAKQWGEARFASNRAAVTYMTGIGRQPKFGIPGDLRTATIPADIMANQMVMASHNTRRSEMLSRRREMRASTMEHKAYERTMMGSRGSFGGLAGGALTAGFLGYFGGRALHAPFGAAGRRESLELAIGANIGSAAQGQDIVSQAYKFAAVTPFGGAEVARSAASLAGVSQDPMGLVKSLAAISSATPGKDVQGISRSVAKMLARGQMTLEGMEPLLTAGLNVPQHFQKFAAQSDPRLANMAAEEWNKQFFDAITRGEIKNSEVTRFLTWWGGQFSAAMMEYTTSIQGRESTLGSAWEEFLISIAAKDTYKGGVGFLTKLLEGTTQLAWLTRGEGWGDLMAARSANIAEGGMIPLGANPGTPPGDTGTYRTDARLELVLPDGMGLRSADGDHEMNIHGNEAIIPLSQQFPGPRQ